MESVNSNNKARISVIIPVYNVEKYLSKCIQSVIEQTYKLLEIILIDDGSADYSLEICREYEKKDSRISVISKEHSGTSDARNMGIERATGDYFLFVDSDDFLHPEMIRILLHELRKNNAQLSVCGVQRVEDAVANNITYPLIETVSTSCYSGTEAVGELFSRNYVTFVMPINKLYDRRLFNSIRFPSGKQHEDEFVAHQLLYSARKVVYVVDKLYYYVQRPNSIMTSAFSERRFQAEEAMEDRVKFCLENRIYQDKAIYRYLKRFSYDLDLFKRSGASKERIEFFQKKYQKSVKQYSKQMTSMYRVKFILTESFVWGTLKKSRNILRIFRKLT